MHINYDLALTALCIAIACGLFLIWVIYLPDDDQ